MKNVELAQKAIQTLVDQNVREFIVCSGARNAPLVKVLGQCVDLKITYFFEERSAAFFAMGRARRTQLPVAVVTTSGTAVAELLPAVVESYYSQVPLVIISADRPQSYQATGAPQTINQVNLFSDYAKKTCVWDFENQKDFVVSQSSPSHLNICFDEPLIDADLQFHLNFPEAIIAKKQLTFSEEAQVQIFNFFNQAKKPLLIVSELSLIDGLELPNIPTYCEASSQLRSKNNPNILKAFDSYYSPNFFKAHFDSVIRIGGVPTHRIWRDLEGALKDIPVLSFSDRPFTGLSRGGQVFPVSAVSMIAPFAFESNELTQLDSQNFENTSQLLSNYEFSEPRILSDISQFIPEGSFVFLGNSLAIREWDQFSSDYDKNFEIGVMRGVNGIDGLVSHFLGRLREDVENWLILGDLSLMYDMAGFALKSVLNKTKVRIVVINNGGGKIFSPMFKDPNFEYPHKIQFRPLAEMFGWEYYSGMPSVFDLENVDFALIELHPDPEETELFSADYRKLKSE